MSCDVLARYVRYELLKAIPLDVENEATLLFLLRTTKALRSDKKAEFQRHVETGKPGPCVWLRTTDVMNAELACADNVGDFLDAHLARIVYFERGASDVAAVVNREDDRLEEVSVSFIEWAVDEDAVFVRRYSYLLARCG